MVDTSIENGCLQVLPDVRQTLQLPDAMFAPVLLLPLSVEELFVLMLSLCEHYPSELLAGTGRTVTAADSRTPP